MHLGHVRCKPSDVAFGSGFIMTRDCCMSHAAMFLSEQREETGDNHDADLAAK